MLIYPISLIYKSIAALAAIWVAVYFFVREKGLSSSASPLPTAG